MCLPFHYSISCGKNIISKNTHSHLHSHISAQVMFYNGSYTKPALNYTRTKKDQVIELRLRIELGLKIRFFQL